MLVASIIALYKNLPLTDIDSFLQGKLFDCGKTKVKESWIKSVSEAKSVLIVEDSTSSGSSIEAVKKKITSSNFKAKFIYLSVYATRSAERNVDIYFEELEQPRIFEWNIYHHGLVERMCFDIDGVLCEDPSPDQNDDGARYLDFLKNTKPKFVPTREIGWLVTSRLEKYRPQTEAWLIYHKIKVK